MARHRIKLIIIIGFLAFCSDAQIQQTKEVTTTIEREIAHIKELHRLEMEGIRKALELQAEEYERRLEILNNEAGQLKAMQATYVPRENFEAFQKQFMGDIEANRKDLIELNKWKATIVGQIALFGIAPYCNYVFAELL